MKKKKLIALIMSFALVAVAAISVGASSTDVAYSDYAGQEWSQGFYTPISYKQNNTPTYVFNKAYIQIGLDEWGLYGSTWIEQTNRGYALIPPRSQYFVLNSISPISSTGRATKLRITRNDHVSGYTYLTGLWSADSVGSYPIANP